MRVIGGKFSRRKINFPKTKETRPVTDRSKETIFNVLGEIVQNTLILDLFAGSGSLGIESISRGANHVCFVDEARASTICIYQNLKLLEIQGQGTVLEMDVQNGIKRLEKRPQKFDLIFLDPPHNKGLIKKTLQHLDRSAILQIHGFIVLGRSNHEALPADLKTLRLRREIKIGQTFVSILEKIDDSEGQESKDKV